MYKLTIRGLDMYLGSSRACGFVRIQSVRNKASRAIGAEKSWRAQENFGNLSRSGRKNLEIIAAQNLMPDDPDGYDKEEYDIEPKKNEYYYKWEIANNSRKGGIGLKRALELFEEMKWQARLTPDFGHFSSLILGCAKAGLTKRAFELYEEGLNYFNKPTGAMVTCLINSCAECPFPEYGLKRLDWLKLHLKAHHNFRMTEIHYRCMIKAYGRLGKIDLAAEVLQEMYDDKFPMTTKTFNMLLIGCASQKQLGSLLALRVYKRMRLYGVKPDIHTYEMFLRCIQYCGMGSPELLNQTFCELPALTSFEQRLVYQASKSNRRIEEFEWFPTLIDLVSSIKAAINVQVSPDTETNVKSIKGGEKLDAPVPFSDNLNETAPILQTMESGILPNLLDDDHLSLVNRIKGIHFQKLNSGAARFQLFGGPEGFLEIMKRDDCAPNIKIFTKLCSLVRADGTGLLPLYHLVRDYPIERDEQFYNIIIKSTCEFYPNRQRMDLALCFLEEMHRDGLRPSVTTFEYLAPACDTLDQALTIIDDIERCGFVVSDKLIEKLLSRASMRKDFTYLNEMIQLIQKRFENYMPTKELLEILEEKIVETNDLLVECEKGKISSGIVPYWINDDYIAKFDQFKQTLGNWLKRVEVYEEEHPWKQYDVKKESKRRGFLKYRETFKALERVKQETLERGQSLGNLYSKVMGERMTKIDE